MDVIFQNKISLHKDNSFEFLKNIPDNSIDMVLTSPPYAERRKDTYGGIKSNDYIPWFSPMAFEIKRVLKETGSFFINIKPHTEKGVRDLYVFKLVVFLSEEVGFNFIDEFSWVKNGFPGDLKGRFKNGFEPIYHFSKGSSSTITFNPLACGAAIKPESTARAFRKQCGKPNNGSKMTGMNTTNLQTLKVGRPSNVIHVDNVLNQYSENKDHPATYPVKLCDFFIKSFSNKGDIILDPFMGSGTTGVSAKLNERRFIGVEIKKDYFDLAKKIIDKKIVQPDLF